MKTLRSFILISACALCSFNTYGQSWQWGLGNDPSFTGVVESAPTAADNAGNSFCAGFMFLADSISFGSYKIIDTAGYQEMFVVKADPSGNVLWVAHTDSSFSEAISIATDNEGNLYLLGMYLDSTCKIGSFTLTNTIGTIMHFVVKFSPTGTILWAQNIAAGSGFIRGGIGVDAQENVYVAGAFGTPTATIGTTTLTNASPTGDSSDIYIVKYNFAGSVLWAKSFGGHANDLSIAMSVTKSGTFYLAGDYTSQTMIIGSDTLTDSLFYLAGTSLYRYPFFAKFDNNGNPIWAKDLPLHVMINDIKGDDSGHVSVTGTIDSNVILGRDTLILAGITNCLTAQYDNAGNILWARSASGHSYTLGYSLAVDTCGNVWVSGSTDSSINFNGTWINPPAVHADLVFIAAYDHCGRYIAGSGTELGSGGDDGMGIALDNMGNLYLGGDYEHIPLILGPDTLQAPATAGEEFFFIAKYTYGPMPCDHAPCCYTTAAANFTDSGTSVVNFHYTGTIVYDSLRWNFGDGTTSTIPNPSHTYTATGSYHACVTIYTAACGTDSMCKDIIVSEGIAAIDKPEDVSIYPNPATHDFVINSPAGFPARSKIEVYDITGRFISSYALSGKNNIIPVGGLMPGVYQCRIIAGSYIITKKLVVER